ncbi:zymogen granule membrane protein 16-like [Sinocyclocheilus anshuiensis]|uniref:zymogen granule membrane protein 16-like n=1 Tax=Sinocyclocheilus anshuiensis TaxID=1608454 RepID=UPI0007B9205E|nr:PREDICTED: zymogen granule membrane protein 16-like [Sinocyclocheilus anshuiensis]
MLQFFLILSAVYALGMAAPLPDLFSYSPAAGDGSGIEFSTASEGRITGIRVWEYNNYWGGYISGFQLRYESNWTAEVGVNSGNPMEMILYDKEAIIQISGKYYSGYIYELVFVTNQGRLFKFTLSGGAVDRAFLSFPALHCIFHHSVHCRLTHLVRRLRLLLSGNPQLYRSSQRWLFDHGRHWLSVQ